jgi:cilia- and flagella-associated protein 57
MSNMMKSTIVSMTLSSAETSLVFTTDSNQIMRTDINMDRKCDESKYDFVIFPFHSGIINGLDICLKKTLIASCSSDNSVRIWNYQTRTLEICETYIDEPISVAFHPSGLHLVIGFLDRVRIMNVYARNLKQIPDININFKGCKEIKFSNGGHLFACTNGYTVNVVRFYQGEQPEDYVFREHMGRVKAIQWLDDDSGLASVGMDGTCIMWRLHPDSLEMFSIEQDRNKEEKKKN